MFSSVQAAHSSNHHRFHTIYSHHNKAQHQEFSKMTPGPNSDDHVENIHSIRQPLGATSRQVSRDIDIIISRKDDIKGTKTPNDFDRKEISNDSSTRPSFTSSDQSSVITARDSCDRDQVTNAITTADNTVPLSSSSTKISILEATNSSSNGQNETDVVHRAPCTSTISSSSDLWNSTLPPSSQTGTTKDTTNVVGTYSGSSNIAHPINASQSTISPSTITTHSIEDRSPPPVITTTGTKRKMPSNVDVSFSHTVGLSQSNTPVSRRDSLPMGLRNKKMKATDCLLFAATLLEQDAAEALVAASTTLSTSLSNNSVLGMSHTTTSFVPPAITSLPVKKTKPLKKMVCEKIERSLQKVALQQKLQQEQQQQVDGDCENKPKDADVLCGRGGKVNKHPGNIVYRKVVEYNKSYYQSVHKKHRILVSQSIVKAILNYGGRFMGQKGKEWTPICFKRAVQKTSQALRERSNSSDVVIQE